MKLFLVAVQLMFLASLSFAQPPDTLWTRTIDGGINGTSINFVRATADGGSCIVGRCCVNLYHAFFVSAFVARMNAPGSEVWSGSFWGAGAITGAEAYAVQPVAAGGYIVSCGAGFGMPALSPTLLRLDEFGARDWVSTYAPYGMTFGPDATASVIVTSAGGFVEIVRSDTLQVVGTDSLGGLRWWRNYPGAELRSVVESSDHGFVACGTDDVRYTYAWLLVKVSSAGDTVWSHRFPLTLGGIAYSLTTTPDRGFLMAGKAFMPDAPLPAYGAMIATDSIGTLLWWRIYDDPPFVCLRPCMEGGYIALSDRLVRINDGGDTLWTRAVPCEACSLSSVDQTADSGFVVSGNSGDIWNGAAHLIKFSREGLAADPRFILPPSSFSLSSYPNPFNPTTTLSFTLPLEGRTKIVIYDLLGREVQTLANSVFTQGEHCVSFNGSALPSGLYFARLESGQYTTTQKLLLLK
jgi:hypothetical protein